MALSLIICTDDESTEIHDLGARRRARARPGSGGRLADHLAPGDDHHRGIETLCVGEAR